MALHGERLDARYALFAIDKEDPPKDWMIHRMDPPADPSREPMPERIVPMLARTGELPGDDDAWGYEIKWDGVRAIAYCDARARCGSRAATSTRSATATRSSGAWTARSAPHAAVLDGEIVAFDGDGRPSFGRCSSACTSPRASRPGAWPRARPVALHDLRPAVARRALADGAALRRAARARCASCALDGESWQTPEHVVGHGTQLLEASDEQDLEGIVAKRLDSRYEPGRRGGSWLKIKTFGPPGVRDRRLAAGQGQAQRRRSARCCSASTRRTGPCATSGAWARASARRSSSACRACSRRCGARARRSRPASARRARPSSPSRELVAEVDFAEWTSAGNIRHPSYKGLRERQAAPSSSSREAHARRGEPHGAGRAGRQGAGRHLSELRDSRRDADVRERQRDAASSWPAGAS